MIYIAFSPLDKDFGEGRRPLAPSGLINEVREVISFLEKKELSANADIESPDVNPRYTRNNPVFTLTIETPDFAEGSPLPTLNVEEP